MRTSACDTDQFCDGVSPLCPSNLDVEAGTSCVDEISGEASTCFGGVCLPSLHRQCAEMQRGLHQELTPPYPPLGGASCGDGGTCAALACIHIGGGSELTRGGLSGGWG